MNLLTASLSPVFLPEELIAEVLSWLTVQPLMRLRCVSKSWNSIISGSTFAKLHLNRSSQNADFKLVHTDYAYKSGYVGVFYATIRLLENPPIIINRPNDPGYQLKDEHFRCVIGSCNGLLCLFSSSCINWIDENWFRIWNPATRTLSQRLGSYRCNDIDAIISSSFSFGCDNSSNTYKIVVLMRTNISVFSLRDNAWRNIQNPQEAPCWTKAVYLDGSVNWLGVHEHFSLYDKNTEQFVIISFDLSTETHTQLLPPCGFHEVPFDIPNLSVLRDCLCFSYDFKQTHFVIWQMMEFGAEDSWTQLFKICYHNLQIDYPYPHLFPIFLSEKNDTLFLTRKYESETIIYNWRDDRVEKIYSPSWWHTCFNYVESLVSYC